MSSHCLLKKILQKLAENLQISSCISFDLHMPAVFYIYTHNCFYHGCIVWFVVTRLTATSRFLTQFLYLQEIFYQSTTWVTNMAWISSYLYNNASLEINIFRWRTLCPATSFVRRTKFSNIMFQLWALVISDIFHILDRLTVDSLGFHDTIQWKRANLRCKASFHSSLVSCIILHWRKPTESLENIFLVAIKYSTGQNVRQIKSRVGQNRIFKFSVGQMSDVRRYFKACNVVVTWPRSSVVRALGQHSKGRRLDSHRGQEYFSAGQVRIKTRSNTTNIISPEYVTNTKTTEHTVVQLLVNYVYPLLSQCA